MSVDLTNVSVVVGTGGTLTLTADVFMNPTVGATFAAVTGGTVAPVVTVSQSNNKVHIVAAIVPDSPVTSAAQTCRFYSDLNNLSQVIG